MKEQIKRIYDNVLGIMIFKSQLQHFKGSYMLIVLAAVGIAIIYLFPRLTKVIPSSIVAIIVITVIVFITKMKVPAKLKVLSQFSKAKKVSIKSKNYSVNIYKVFV